MHGKCGWITLPASATRNWAPWTSASTDIPRNDKGSQRLPFYFSAHSGLLRCVPGGQILNILIRQIGRIPAHNSRLPGAAVAAFIRV